MNTKTVLCFSDLDSWKQSHLLALDIYKISGRFPKTEIYNLISQIQRAAVSVGANIAEGFYRYHYKEKMHFYYIARGSLGEVQNFLHISKDLGYISKNEFDNLWNQSLSSLKLVNGLIKAVEKRV